MPSLVTEDREPAAQARPTTPLDAMHHAKSFIRTYTHATPYLRTRKFLPTTRLSRSARVLGTHTTHGAHSRTQGVRRSPYQWYRYSLAGGTQGAGAVRYRPSLAPAVRVQ